MHAATAAVQDRASCHFLRKIFFPDPVSGFFSTVSRRQCTAAATAALITAARIPAVSLLPSIIPDISRTNPAAHTPARKEIPASAMRSAAKTANIRPARSVFLFRCAKAVKRKSKTIQTRAAAIKSPEGIYRSTRGFSYTSLPVNASARAKGESTSASFSKSGIL